MQPTYSCTSVFDPYRYRQSTIVGKLLIVVGCLSVIFNAAVLVAGTNTTFKPDLRRYKYSYPYEELEVVEDLSHVSNGKSGHGLWCGAAVSICNVGFD